MWVTRIKTPMVTRGADVEVAAHPPTDPPPLTRQTIVPLIRTLNHAHEVYPLFFSGVVDEILHLTSRRFPYQMLNPIPSPWPPSGSQGTAHSQSTTTQQARAMLLLRRLHSQRTMAIQHRTSRTFSTI